MTDLLTIEAHLESNLVGSSQKSKPATGSLGIWTDMQVRMVDVPRKPKIKVFPENKEPEIVWILSGETVTEERVLGGQWLQTNGKAGDFYLTAPGPAYEVKSYPQGVQPLRLMCIKLSASLMAEAMAELFGKDASKVAPTGSIRF